MAGENIRINELPADAAPSASDVVAIDGTTTRKATLTDAVAAGRPTASQAEAEAGVNALKAMTPLTTKQAIVAQGAALFASAAQGATADSAVQTITGGVSAEVDATDPQNPVINFTGLGTGDMLAANYDPDEIGGNAFNQDNMVDGTTNKNYTATEKTKLSGIEALADVTDATNVAAAGAAMAASNLSDLASIPTSASNLGIIRNVVKIYAADGGGTNPNDTAFGNANTAGGLIFIPKPPTKYAFTGSFTTTAAAWLPDPSMTWDQLTDGGKFNMRRGHVTGAGNGANIWRFQDRVFIGEAASKFAGSAAGTTDAGTSWLSSESDGPAYLGIGATLLVTKPTVADIGSRVAAAFALQSNDTANGGIVVGIFGRNSYSGSSGSTWGQYLEMSHEVGVGGTTTGIELSVRNASSSNSVPTAYSSTKPILLGMMISCWPVGSAPGYGPDPANPGAMALYIAGSWNKGLVFSRSGIVGTDGTSGSSTFGVAIEMGRNQQIRWAEPTTEAEGSSITGMVTAATSKVTQEFRNNEIRFNGANGAGILRGTHQASAQNWLLIYNAATAVRPILQANGNDTNVDGRLQGKGTGGWDFYAGATKFAFNATGIGYFGVTPVGQKTMAAATGTATRTTFDTASVTLPQLAERVKALIDDFRSYGLHA